MGSSVSSDEFKEKPDEKYDATLYYFAGRGLADQIRWLLAATEISFTQRVINERQRFVSMAKYQLPFGQLPMIQIDGLELAESQACVRYLARRSKIIGKNDEEQVKCDMIAEACRDMIMIACQAPFQRYRGNESAVAHTSFMKDKWTIFGARFEYIISNNSSSNKKHLVGDSLTYADILVAHVLTWFVEECGPDITSECPLLVDLQNLVVNLPGLQKFIRGPNYYPKGNDAFVTQCYQVLGRGDQIKHVAKNSTAK